MSFHYVRFPQTADYYDTGYKVYIGPQRYFVTSDVGDGRIQWYAFFALPPGTKKAPSGWGGSERDGQSDPEENLVEYIKSLHQGWSDEIMTVLDSTPPDSVEQRDLYDRAPEFFRSWADGNVVLMGDAIHGTFVAPWYGPVDLPRLNLTIFFLESQL